MFQRTRKIFNQSDNSKPILPILQKEKKSTGVKKRKTKVKTVDSRFKKFKSQIPNITKRKVIANPFRDNKPLKLTWTARRILEFLKLMFPKPQSLKAIKSAIKMHKILVANNITRLIALELIEAKKGYDKESKRYESIYLITNSTSGKGSP